MDDAYEIRVRGPLSDGARAALADEVRAFEPVETILRGAVSDQAELRGVLARLEELGCELLEARRLTPRRRARRRPPGAAPG